MVFGVIRTAVGNAAGVLGLIMLASPLRLTIAIFVSAVVGGIVLVSPLASAFVALQRLGVPTPVTVCCVLALAVLLRHVWRKYVVQAFLLPEATPKRDLPRVAIVGTGFGGLILAIKLRQIGVPFTVFERSHAVGGVWRDNAYPGSGCDIPAMVYQLSFEQHAWSCIWPARSEIMAYINGLWDKHKLRSHVQLNTAVVSASWDKKTSTWKVVTSQKGGKERTQAFDVFVSCVGQLSEPSVPGIPGLDTFKGDLFHSARWPRGLDLSNKRVAIIGAGATAVQIVPAIADQVKSCTVFQRTPSYVFAKGNRVFSRLERLAMEYVPLYSQCYRWAYFILADSLWYMYAHKASAASKLMSSGAANGQLNEQVSDPVLLKKLTPNFTFMCRRTLFSSEYYPTLQKRNVNLVAEPVVSIESDALVTKSGERHEVDVVVAATGFKTTQFLASISVTGASGKTLKQAWNEKGGAHAYLGVSIPTFPNLFMLYGPNTNLGHNSILWMLECQANYVANAVKLLARSGAKSMDVRPEVMEAYHKKVGDEMDKLVFSADCNSWYRTADGAFPNNAIFSCIGYWMATRFVDMADYCLS